MSNIKGIRLSLDEVYDYFDDYNIELKKFPREHESIEAFISLHGIQVVIIRSYKKDNYSKTKTKSRSFCIAYGDLLNADCFVTFLDEKLDSELTKLRDEVK